MALAEATEWVLGQPQGAGSVGLGTALRHHCYAFLLETFPCLKVLSVSLVFLLHVAVILLG